MKQLTLGSLFDGIGGFPLAAQRCGIKTLWASEITPASIEITKRHFPRMAHLGDITKLHGGEIPPVDIISFGSPCQDLSMAGTRMGLGGERSGLFRDAIRIIYEMREATNGRYPTFIIWENVNGAFSSNGGNDFRTVIEEITNTRVPMPNSGRWATAGMVRGCRGGANIAWRQFDSQYWGVPQRRKRIFLVGDFRTDRTPQILFESESLLGYVEKSGQKRKEVAASIIGGVEATSGDNQGKCVVDFGRTADRVYINADTARAITASDGGGGSATGLYLLREGEPVTHAINLQVATRHNKLGEGTGMGVADEGQPAYTLQAAHSHQGGSVMDITQSGVVPTLRAQTHGHPPLAFAVYPINDGSIHGNANGLGFGEEGREAPTLTASDRHAIAACYTPSGYGGYDEGVRTLRARAGRSGFSSSNILISFERFAFYVRYVLRKLTPLECERLQGFPDNWTKYDTTGAIIADTPRYTALGNSLTVHCAERVFRGIVAVVGGVSGNV